MSGCLKSRKFTKTGYFGASRSFKVIDVGTPGKLVSTACKSVSICSRFLARLVNTSRNRAVWKKYPNLTPRTEDSLILGCWNVDYWNVRLMLKISYAGCLGLSSVISAQFTLEMIVCRSLKSRKIYYNPLFWGFRVVQGHRCWYPRKARQQCLLW